MTKVSIADVKSTYKPRNFNYFQERPEDEKKELDIFSFPVLRNSTDLPTSWCWTSMSKTMAQ